MPNNLNDNLTAINTPLVKSDKTSALKFAMTQEPTAYLHRTAISNRRGTIQTNFGALVDFKDITGGTSIFTYDPITGAVIIRGNVGFNFIDSGGTTRVGIGIGTDGFGRGTFNEIDFSSNTSNKLIENFGPTAGLADSLGFHGFHVQNSAGTQILSMYSNGMLELLGICASPSAGTTHTARLYLGTTGGGKDQLLIQWSDGSVGTLSTQP